MRRESGRMRKLIFGQRSETASCSNLRKFSWLMAQTESRLWHFAWLVMKGKVLVYSLYTIRSAYLYSSSCLDHLRSDTMGSLKPTIPEEVWRLFGLSWGARVGRTLDTAIGSQCSRSVARVFQKISISGGYEKVSSRVEWTHKHTFVPYVVYMSSAQQSKVDLTIAYHAVLGDSEGVESVSMVNGVNMVKSLSHVKTALPSWAQMPEFAHICVGGQVGCVNGFVWQGG